MLILCDRKLTLRAVVLMADTSDPAEGSLMPRQATNSPEIEGARKLRL